MTTDPIDYRAEAVALFARAKAALGETDETYDVPADYAVVGILAALLALDDDALNREEQHQSEKFEAETIDYFPGFEYHFTPGEERRELDEDNPDTLVGDAGLAEAPKGWQGFDDPPEPQEIGAGFVTTREDEDEADTIARPVSFGGILDTPRVDFYGTPGPWSAA